MLFIANSIIQKGECEFESCSGKLVSVRMPFNLINRMHMIVGAVFTGMFMLVSIDDGIMRFFMEMGMRVIV
jgi:hypothetical protein